MAAVSDWDHGFFFLAAKRMVFKAESLHLGGVQEISRVNDQRPGHFARDTLPIKASKLVPFGREDDRIRVLNGVISIGRERNLR